jgi:capsular polysaccharide biosynthesis protein
VVVDELITVDGFAVTAHYLSPLIRDYATALHSRPTAGSRKLFMPRRPAWARNIIDLDGVQDVLNGFETVYPEDLPVDAQIDAMQGVSTIVSVLGSSLTNVLFAPPGARVLALAPDVMTDTFFWRLCALLGHEYVELRCATAESEKSSATGRPLDRDILVDTHALAEWTTAVS